MKSVRVAEDEGWSADANSGLSSEWAGKIKFEEFENSDSGTNLGLGTTSIHECNATARRSGTTCTIVVRGG